MTVDRIVQSDSQVTVVYKLTNGQLVTVVYQPLPPQETTGQTASTPPAPYSPPVTYSPPPPVDYYPDNYYPDYYYPGYYWPYYAPVTIGLGFGWGWYGGYYGYRGGAYYGGYHGGSHSGGGGGRGDVVQLAGEFRTGDSLLHCSEVEAVG